MRCARAIGQFVWRLNRGGRQVEVDFDDGSSVDIGADKLAVFCDAASQSAMAFAELYGPANGFLPHVTAAAVVVDAPVSKLMTSVPDEPSNIEEPDHAEGGDDGPAYGGPEF